MRLKRSASSQTRSASGACARFTSYWPGPYSASEEVAGTSCSRHTRSISASRGEYSLRSVIELICVRYSRRPVSGPRGGCGSPAALRSRVDQIELVFDRDDRRESERAQGLELLFEDAARIAEEARAVVFEHAQLHLRDVVLPRHRHERSGNRHAGTIRVAVIESEAGGLDGAALDVEREHRAGQGHAAREHAGDTRAVDPLAAFDGVQVVHETRRRTGPRDERPGSARARVRRRWS